MSPPALRTLAAAAVVAAAALAALAPRASAQEYKEQFKDEILVKGAKAPLTGVEITLDSYERLEWKSKSGGAQKKDAAEILSVTYGDAPVHYQRGLEASRAGRFAEAAEQFRGIAAAVAAGRSRRFWEARGLAYQADSLRRQAAAEKNPARFLEAARMFEDALQKDPKSPILDMVYEGIAESKAGGGDGNGALKALDEFRSTSAAVGRSVWEATARWVRGRVLDRQGETAGAANEYGDLAAFAATKAAAAPADSVERRELERLKVAGLVGRGWALFAKAEKTKAPADLDAAKAFFEGLPRDAGGSVAGKAASLNGIGAVLLAQGKAREALEKFVEVEVTMFAVPDEVTRALWYKAQALGRLGNNAGRDSALRDLVEYYPWSEWAARAR